MSSKDGLRRPRVILHDFDDHTVWVQDADSSLALLAHHRPQRRRPHCGQPGKRRVEVINVNAQQGVANIGRSPVGPLWTRFRCAVLKQLHLKETQLVDTAGPLLYFDRAWNSLYLGQAYLTIGRQSRAGRLDI